MLMVDLPILLIHILLLQFLHNLLLLQFLEKYIPGAAEKMQSAIEVEKQNLHARFGYLSDSKLSCFSNVIALFVEHNLGNPSPDRDLKMRSNLTDAFSEFGSFSFLFSIKTPRSSPCRIPLQSSPSVCALRCGNRSR